MRTRRCINGRTPESGTNTISGARLIPVLPRPTDANLPAEAKSTNPVSPGRGFLCTIASRPTHCCKGRSDSFTEISSDAPTTRRFGPPTPEEKARRLAVLRAVLADSAPEFQARIDAGERGEQP